MEAAKQQTQSHFILVHGACHGAWCWYKLKPLLESHGHKVTVLDLAASGINMKKIEEVPTLYDYTLPLMKLMESLPLGEKVILVGHSLGGMNLALVMDKFPEKISVAVFLTAFMPDTVHKPSFVIDQCLKGTTPESWLDAKFETCGTPEVPLTTVFFGPKFMASKLYQLCPIQDFTLATMLVRTGSFFLEDLAQANNFSHEGYGSVPRVFIVCNEDYAITKEHQWWMIENIGGVKEENPPYPPAGPRQRPLQRSPGCPVSHSERRDYNLGTCLDLPRQAPLKSGLAQRKSIEPTSSAD